MTKKEFVKMYCVFNDSRYMDSSRTLQYAEEMAVKLDEAGYFDRTDEICLYDLNQTLKEIESRLDNIALK